MKHAALIAVFAASPVFAQSFTGLGIPSVGTSQATAISADGLVVVGYAGDFSTGVQAFRWTAQTGRIALAGNPNYRDCYAGAVSSDGSVIAGSVNRPNGDQIAVRWTGTGAPQLLGTLPNGLFSSAIGISRSGTFIVGTSDYQMAFGPRRAFRWSNGSMLNLGVHPNIGLVDFTAIACSDDGAVVVGDANDLGGSYHVYRWTAQTGMVEIGSLGPVESTYTGDVSADGSIIVGSSQGLPFRWVMGSGMVALPVTAGTQYASAVALTADGSVAAGNCGAFVNHAVYWDAAGVHDLADALGAAVPAGWLLQQATGIADEGRTICGYGLHNGAREGWIATLATSACYPNCDASTTAPILNVLDFTCFLNAFASGSSYANCDGSTVAPILNVLDFTCFLNAFAAGCP